VKVDLLTQIRAAGLPAPVTEYEFARDAGRLWRFDYAWTHPAVLLAVEQDGGTFSGGRHVRGRGFEEDAKKVNEATLRGWRVLRVTTRMVETGEALALVRRALGARGGAG
jgi:hypothetical protein